MEYETEEQQVEALKKWWAENGKSVILGVGIGAAAIFGWQFWGNYQTGQSMKASDAYQETISALSNDGDAAALAEAVKDNHGGSLYATLAALAAAADRVGAGDLDAAAKELKWAADNSPQKEIALIAKVRLARVQGAQGDVDAAFKSLPSSVPKAFTALVEEVKGDLYVANGEEGKARTAYQAALDSGEAIADRNALSMKLNDLAVADAS